MLRNAIIEGVLRLRDLTSAAEAAATLEGEVDGEAGVGNQLRHLLYLSSPMGGARPKTVVMDDAGQLWVVKFRAREDRWNNAIIEAAFLELAGICGIRVPQTQIVRLGDHDVLLVKRFDQKPSQAGPIRRPFISSNSLLDLGEDVVRRDGWSYLDLAQVIRKVSGAPEADTRELFRRAVLNALVSNLDDHPRNHAMLFEEDGWRLSPAYDLTPARTASQDERELALACGIIPGRERWANRYNLISGAGYFGLDEGEAGEVITTMKSLVLASWEDAVLRQGGTQQDCANISHAIVSAYPSFEYESSGGVGA